NSSVYWRFGNLPSLISFSPYSRSYQLLAVREIEAGSMSLAIVEDALAHESAVVVRVHAEHRKRQVGSDLLKCLAITSIWSRTRMATHSVQPVGERTYRDAASNRRTHTFAALALPIDVRTRLSQHAIDRRSADLQDLGLHSRIKVKMSVPFHGIDQHRDQSLQAFTANPISRFPQDRQGLAHHLVVKTVAGAHHLPNSRRLSQHSDRVLR
ncbi:hypothetical protein QTH97_32110, partial [Variovorax sp. J22R24]|uniref:hypothetical protein n=1 Tax=Variovorax gracilis TaxID=3053502 RepID=UPI0025752BF2